MKFKKLLQFSWIILLIVAFLGCEKVDPPEPDFSASIYYSGDDEIQVSFSDLSSNSPDAWEWTFEGGYPSTSMDQNPIISYDSDGIYQVTLVAKNDGGSNEIIKYDFVNIVEFNNPTHTVIDISVGSNSNEIEVDESVLFGSIDNTSVSVSAFTYAATTGGSQLGERVSWNETVSLLSSTSYNLNVTNEFVFLYMQNYGNEDLADIYIYDDFTDYFYSDYAYHLDIVIPNDDVKYRIGYYYTNEDMYVEAYRRYSSGSIVWYDFSFSYYDNQSMNCYTYNSKTSTDRTLSDRSGNYKTILPAIEKASHNKFKNSTNINPTK